MSDTTAVTINGDEHIIIALDTSASMHTQDAPTGGTRMGYARERAAELIKRLPKDTQVTVLGVGLMLNVMARATTGIGARAALTVLGFMDGGCNPARALEWCLRELRGQQRATLMLFTDGLPDDPDGWIAWSLYNQFERESALAVHVLTLGEITAPGRFYPLPGGKSERRSVTALERAELRLGTHNKSDRPDAAHAPTVPPSISPPEPAKPAPKQPAKNALSSPAPALPARKKW